MKKSIVIMKTLLFAAALFSTAAAAGKMKIAVIDFQSIGSDISRTEMGQAIAENLRTALIDSQKFSVIERTSLKKIFEEQKLQYSGAIDQNTAVQIGKVAGAEKIVMGSVTKLGDMYTINVRFIDVATGVATEAKKVTGTSQNQLPRMIDDIVALLTGEAVSAAEPAPAPAAETKNMKSAAKDEFPRHGFKVGIGPWTPDLTVIKEEFKIDSLSMVIVPLVYRYDKNDKLSFKAEISPAGGNTTKKTIFGNTNISVFAVPVLFSAIRSWPRKKSNLFVEGGLGFVNASLTWSLGALSQTGSGTSACVAFGGGGEMKMGENSYLGASLRMIGTTVSRLTIKSTNVPGNKVNETWSYTKNGVKKDLPLDLSGGVLNIYVRFLF